jgi:REP element-mobilizing transposase RayT
VICLRRQQVARVLLRALNDSNRESFRIVHYSVQANHVHLIVEASEANLVSCMRGLAVRLAKRVNRVLRRRGRFCADRWHAEALTSPRQTRKALVYVLQSHKKHTRVGECALDPLSSAEWFVGFAEDVPKWFRGVGPPCIAEARTWLLNVGWRRHGRIHLWEAPKRK